MHRNRKRYSRAVPTAIGKGMAGINPALSNSLKGLQGMPQAMN